MNSLLFLLLLLLLLYYYINVVMLTYQRKSAWKEGSSKLDQCH